MSTNTLKSNNFTKTGPKITMVGCSSAEEVSTLADTGRNFKPLSSEESSQLLKVFEPHAKRMAYYRGVL